MGADAVKREADRARREIVELPAALVQQFASMAMMIPETESDGGASILEAILNAKDVHDLDTAWDVKDPEKLCDQVLIVTDFSRSASDYADGLGVFLVVDAIIAAKKEKITFTTGSMAVVAQLTKAYAQGAIPLRCVMRKAEKPTKSGYYPMHLEIEEEQPEPGLVIEV